MGTLALQLKQACVAGDVDAVQQLLDAGADPDSTDEHGSGTLLSFHPEVLRRLLAGGADPDRQTNENGATVLAGLAYVHQVECVRMLLEHGADPDRGRAASGETPLHHALAGQGGDSGAVVRLLLDFGADPDARTIAGVVSHNFWRDVRTRGESPLHRAAAFASAETIGYLLTAGADPALLDANGDTPRAWASWHRRDWEIVAMLDPDRRGATG
jgi:ankyrin repeat protein